MKYVLHIRGHSKIKNMHITKVLCKSKERAMLLKRKSKSLFLMTGLNTETRRMKKEGGYFITLHVKLQLN